MFKKLMQEMPLVAILRGITPDEVEEIADMLVGKDFRIIEVPLNSPSPLRSIEILAKKYGDQLLIGAGTVLSTAKVDDVANAGGKLIVMPHADADIIRAAKSRGLVCTPGIITPTEGFAALNAGCDALKLFPAEMIAPKGLKALRSVFPKETMMLPVGGITPEVMGDYITSGASGFGLGSALYRVGDDVATVSKNASQFVTAMRQCTQQDGNTIRQMTAP